MTPAIPQVLHNGAVGYAQQMPQQQMSSLTIQLPLGPSVKGSRNLIETMLKRGSPATKQLISQFEAQGITVRPVIAGDKLVMVAHGPGGQEAQMLQAALTLLLRPTWDAPSFHAVKSELLTELGKIRNEPDQQLTQAANRALFGTTHPYGKTLAEAEQEVSRQTYDGLAGLYQHMLAFPERISLAMHASLPQDSQVQLMNQAIQQFGWYASPYRQGLPLADEPAIPPARGVQEPVLIADPNIKRAHLVRGWRTPGPNDPDYPAFLVLQNWLGGMSGVFFRVFRSENGLVYGTRAMNTLRKAANDYKVFADVNFEKLPQALQAYDRVIDEVTRHPITDAQLATARNTIQLQLQLGAESTEKAADSNMRWLVNDQPPMHPQQLEAAVMRVTAADVQRVARRYLDPALGHQVTAVVAPPEILRQVFPNRPFSQL
jgi:zinc protease